MSIATQRGDGGETALAGGTRVPKDDARVETYGTIDELISTMGFARAICPDDEIRRRTYEIQRELFRVGSTIATPRGSRKPVPELPDAMIYALTEDVHRIEAMEGILSDWSIPGEDAAAAAYDVARTVCRRAERLAVSLMRGGTWVEPNALKYLNRLSDLLWLFGRQLEMQTGKSGAMRDLAHAGPRWSRVW